jgi:hypothetical protein
MEEKAKSIEYTFYKHLFALLKAKKAQQQQ